MIIGQTIRGAWTVTNLTTGAEANATGTPTAVLFRNGSVVGAATPSMSNPGTGHYHSGVLLDAGHSWAVGDHYALVASWVEPGTAAAKKLILAQGVIAEAMRGTDGANTTAPDNTQGAAVITALGDVLGVPIDTNLATDISHIQLAVENLDFATPTNVTDAQTAIISQVDANETKIDTLTANLATVDTVVDGIQADLSNGTDGLTALKAAVDAIFTTAIAESYAASGAAGTPAQILYMIQQAITEFAISGTTKTIKKLNGSTTAATETLDDATNPTSITRAT